MNEKQNIKKDSFKLAGEELIQKVRKAQQPNWEEIQSSWQQIERQTGKPVISMRKRFLYAASIAAVTALLFSVGFMFHLNQNKNESLSLALLNDSSAIHSSNEIVLIAQNEKIQIQDQSTINYEPDGKLNIDKHSTKENNVKEKSDSPKEEMNQIIVPKGKRANITFSDGTKMYINSDSKVIYPAVFKKDKREILVEGEVFLEVCKDAARPFIVKTNGFDVKVLGTQFNVCAYKNAPSATVVLVNGSVEVNTGKTHEKALLRPNQLIEINDNSSSIKEVDVFEYICWKENMMLLNDHKAGETLDRLARYYGRTIRYDESIRSIPISGKLDLKENIEDAIDIICLSLALKYTVDENNNIIITSN